ncbi:MAG: RagB/SusD family nutrient uptake outer membrane protein [Bacteroidota bacterium]
MNHFTKYLLSILFMVGSLMGCHKTEFLEAKPNASIIIPTSLEELRALLDNTNVFTVSPGIGEISADNYYVSTATWQSLSQLEHNLYSWEKDSYGGVRSIDDWNIPWQQVLYTNIVLEQLNKLSVDSSMQKEWQDCKGSALFLRAHAFYNLLLHFAAAYDNATATTDPGIPLRLTTNIHDLRERASVQDSYNQVLADLSAASPLLSENVSASYRNRPSKPAVFGLLSRVYLSMGKYDKAGSYADSCLLLYNKLINFNTLSTTATTPFDRLNDENIYYCQAINYNVLLTISTTTLVDTTLYQSYAANDLRKQLYFRQISGPNYGIKRGHSGTTYPFTGLSTEEMYLNRAESYARAGNSITAMNDLNTVLVKRWKTGTYVPQTANTAAEALQKILTERRKELIWRGLRWPDLKRLNKENAGINLTRILNNQPYSLTPNSPLYVFPIPDNEISLSGIAQNPR